MRPSQEANVSGGGGQRKRQPGQITSSLADKGEKSGCKVDREAWDGVEQWSEMIHCEGIPLAVGEEV